MEAMGQKTWIIPDGYIAGRSGSQISHDAVCVLNSGDADAEVSLTLYFEETAPMSFETVCKAERTHHIRMDRIKNAAGQKVPRDTPYAILVRSSVPIVVQYSRLDTTANDTALMTTIAYPVR